MKRKSKRAKPRVNRGRKAPTPKKDTVFELASIGMLEAEVAASCGLRVPLKRNYAVAYRRGRAEHILTIYQTAFQALKERRTAVVLSFWRLLHPEGLQAPQGDPEAVRAEISKAIEALNAKRGERDAGG